MTEGELTTQLIEALQDDFDIRREVKGYNLLSRSQIRADIVAHPKLHVIDTGFADAHFCIEVKAVPHEKPEVRAREAAWQALSYRLSEFDFGVPVFALVYPPLKEFYPQMENPYYGPYRELVAIMQKGNVGWIELSGPTKWKARDIRIMFSAGRYWSKVTGMTPVKNLGTRLHVGTRK